MVYGGSHILDLSDEDFNSLREKMKGDLKLFTRIVLGHHLRNDEGVSYPICEAQETVCNMLIERQPRTCIVLPRGHAKSTYVSTAYPLHSIAYELDRFIVIISETREQSKLFLESIKDEIENNEVFQYFFGDLRSPDKWSEYEVETRPIPAYGREAIKIVAKGAGQRARGLKWGKYRPTLIIMDDFESEQNTETEDQIDKLKRWVDGAVMPSLSSSGRVVFVGTIVHEDSYLNSVKNDPGYAVNPHKHWQIVNDEWTEVLWEGRWSLRSVNMLRESYARKGYEDLFYQEYMNQPISPSNQIFKREMFRQYDGDVVLKDGISYIEWNDSGLEDTKINLFAGVDPATGGATSDNTVIVVVGMDKDNFFYIVDIIAGKFSPTDTMDKLFDLKTKWGKNLKSITIETIAYQAALADFVRREEIKRNSFLGILEVKSRQSKGNRYADRLTGLEPRYRAGQIMHRRVENELEGELLLFNPTRKNNRDDRIDALWSAIINAFKPSFAEKIIKTVKSIRNRDKKGLNWRIL